MGKLSLTSISPNSEMSERSPTMREKDATSAFQSVNGGGKGSPSDRPRGRPVSENLMKQHHSLSNWTNIVKTSKKTWSRVGKLSQQSCARSYTFR